MTDGQPANRDLYADLLGLPPGPRPPDHYALLGLPLFASDLQQIDSAVHRRMERLDEFSLHPDGDVRRGVQNLMNQVAQARVCLVDPAAKEQYDHQLRARHGLDLIYIPARAPEGRTTEPAPGRQKIRKFAIAGALAAAGLAVVLVILWVALRHGGQTSGIGTPQEPIATPMAPKPLEVEPKSARPIRMAPPIHNVRFWPEEASSLGHAPKQNLVSLDPPFKGFIEQVPPGEKSWMSQLPPPWKPLSQSDYQLRQSLMDLGDWELPPGPRHTRRILRFRNGTFRVWNVYPAPEPFQLEVASGIWNVQDGRLVAWCRNVTYIVALPITSRQVRVDLDDEKNQQLRKLDDGFVEACLDRLLEPAANRTKVPGNWADPRNPDNDVRFFCDNGIVFHWFRRIVWEGKASYDSLVREPIPYLIEDDQLKFDRGPRGGYCADPYPLTDREEPEHPLAQAIANMGEWYFKNEDGETTWRFRKNYLELYERKPGEVSVWQAPWYIEDEKLVIYNTLDRKCELALPIASDKVEVAWTRVKDQGKFELQKAPSGLGQSWVREILAPAGQRERLPEQYKVWVKTGTSSDRAVWLFCDDGTVLKCVPHFDVRPDGAYQSVSYYALKSWAIINNKLQFPLGDYQATCSFDMATSNQPMKEGTFSGKINNYPVANEPATIKPWAGKQNVMYVPVGESPQTIAPRPPSSGPAIEPAQPTQSQPASQPIAASQPAPPVVTPPVASRPAAPTAPAQPVLTETIEATFDSIAKMGEWRYEGETPIEVIWRFRKDGLDIIRRTSKTSVSIEPARWEFNGKAVTFAEGRFKYSIDLPILAGQATASVSGKDIGSRIASIRKVEDGTAQGWFDRILAPARQQVILPGQWWWTRKNKKFAFVFCDRGDVIMWDQVEGLPQAWQCHLAGWWQASSKGLECTLEKGPVPVDQRSLGIPRPPTPFETQQTILLPLPLRDRGTSGTIKDRLGRLNEQVTFRRDVGPSEFRDGGMPVMPSPADRDLSPAVAPAIIEATAEAVGNMGEWELVGGDTRGLHRENRQTFWSFLNDYAYECSLLSGTTPGDATVSFSQTSVRLQDGKLAMGQYFVPLPIKDGSATLESRYTASSGALTAIKKAPEGKIQALLDEAVHPANLRTRIPTIWVGGEQGDGNLYIFCDDGRVISRAGRSTYVRYDQYQSWEIAGKELHIFRSPRFNTNYDTLPYPFIGDKAQIKTVSGSRVFGTKALYKLYDPATPNPTATAPATGPAPAT